MGETSNEKKYLDSVFRGVAVDSAPIKDNFGKNFVAKKFSTPLEISAEQLKKFCLQFNCSEENFFMGAYALLLARFSGADEVFFAAAATKKFQSF